MAGASFVQSDFQGGEWAPAARGRMEDPQYKTAMQTCRNGFPLRNKAWTRRPGFKFMANSRKGAKARLMTFAFSQSSPFEIEFTDTVARFYLADGPIFSGTFAGIASISAANPAVVTANNALPSDWAAGDTIEFSFTPPMSADKLSGRRFTISNLTATSFAITDALTGVTVDGSTFTYTPSTQGTPDRALKVFEVSGLPYTKADFDQIRIIQNDATALILHPNYPPRALTQGTLSSAPFLIAAQAFSDGPYLNINTTATTLAASAATGSVTITASATGGINGGQGFLPTDVNRLIRIQSAPPVWGNGTYNKNAVVTGSDGNVYIAVNKNTAVDPTTDNSLNWAATGNVVQWNWATITAVTDATHVTATLNGPAMLSLTATTQWQLGLYSDTTGWPAAGVYHEGRFWLAGAAGGINRIDGSNSNDVFNFAPTSSDGTVGDANAVAVISNADTQNQIVWLLTAQEGILAGTISGEWLVRSSQFGDPITPTSIQIRRVSTYGCAPIEPQIASLTTVFVQKQQRKLLDFDHYPYGETAGWFANDLALLSDHLTAPGIAELRWQQEPNHILWIRKTDGTLAGTVFQHGPGGFQAANIYNGWFKADLGGNRSIVSIAAGPTANGLSTTLYVAAKNNTTGYHEILALDSVFDDGVDTTQQRYTDGMAPISTIQQKAIASGDSIDGIELQGLWNANGQTLSVSIGGLDLGDFAVANGRIDIPYSGSFTSAFLAGLPVPTVSSHALPLKLTNSVAYNQVAFGAYVANLTNYTSASSSFEPNIDTKNRWLIAPSSAGGGGFRLFDLDKMTEIVNQTAAQLVAAGSTFPGAVAGYNATQQTLFTTIVTGNYEKVGRFSLSKAGLVLTGTIGTAASFSPPGTIPAVRTFFVPIDARHMICGGFNTVNSANKVTVFDGIALGNTMAVQTIADSGFSYGVSGPGDGSYFVLGTPNYGSGALSIPVTLYKASAPYALLSSLGTVAPAAVDATWTNFSGVTGLAYDPNDGGLLAFFSTTDAVTNKNYWVKFNANSNTIKWKTAVSYAVPFTGQTFAQADLSSGTLVYYGGGNINSLALGTGTLTVTAFPGNVTTNTAFGGQLPVPSLRGTLVALTATAWVTNPVFIGPQTGNIPVAQYALFTVAGPASSPATTWPPGNFLTSVAGSVGFTYTSQGQIMPPDFGRDAGAINGPAFGKIRRLHWYGMNVDKAGSFSVGANFTNMFSITFQNYQEVAISPPATFTGTLSDTVDADYDFDSAIAWQVTRPTPLTVTAVSGYIESVDK